jgi:hypothetical protein
MLENFSRSLQSIVSFINIPFEIPFVRGVFMTFMNVFFGAFFFLGFAASILYPVMNQHEVIDSN